MSRHPICCGNSEQTTANGTDMNPISLSEQKMPITNKKSKFT